MKIGILQAGHGSPAMIADEGDYPKMFETMLDGHGFTFETFTVVDGIFPASIAAAEGWIITGSKHGAYDDLPWISKLEALIREIYSAGQPLIGVCFGHQVVATALGGRVEKFEGGWAIGPKDYVTQDGSTFKLNAWHQDQVLDPPKEAEILAGNDFCQYAMLGYRDQFLTLQPHPEYTKIAIGHLIDRYRDRAPDGILDAVADTLDDPNDASMIADQFADFLLQHAKEKAA